LQLEVLLRARNAREKSGDGVSPCYGEKIWEKKEIGKGKRISECTSGSRETFEEQGHPLLRKKRE